MDISKRKKTILSAIVVLHTNSGDPVGSNILNSFLEDLSVSSATLRNEMAELTSIGLLEQPHTSAGRIPTAGGYRYYVDNLMMLYPPTKAERDAIDSIVASLDSDPDKAAEAATRELSSLSGLPVFASTPKGAEKIVHFELLQVGRFNIAVLGVTDAGSLKSRVCRVTKELTASDIRSLEAVFNDHLTFVSNQDVNPVLIGQVNAMLGDTARELTPVISAALSLVKHAGDVDVFTSGQECLLRFSEFGDHMKELLELFGDSVKMEAILDEGLEESAKVMVGDELESFGPSSLGLVLSRYRSQGGLTGGIGVAGPVRMNYAFIIPRLCYFCNKLGEMLNNESGNTKR